MLVLPRIGKAGVFQELVVGQALEKGNQIALFRFAQFKAADIQRLVWIVVTNTGIRSRVDRPAAGGVVVNYLRECRNAAVMHIRRSDGDVSQRRRPELTDVFAPLRELIQPGIRSGIGKLASNVVQADVQKRNPRQSASFISEGTVQVPAAVALKTARALTGEKQNLTAFCGI